MTQPRLLILDNDIAILDALRLRLQIAGFGVSDYSNPRHFLEVADLDAELLLLDVRMPEIDGLEVLAAVRGRAPTLPVIMMSGHGDIPLAVQAMRDGAFDFIEKPFSDDRLMASIGTALDAGRERSAHESAARVARIALESLTPRETEVLQLLVKGKPNKLIAFELGCSQRTVEVHRARIMQKLPVSSLAELVRFAMLAGVPESTEPPPA